tara:strand:- start:2551 stop:2715 length:165 start_codon:yes stop_codon:yes gene_type:complete
MDTWAIFWAVVLIVVLIIFTVVSVVVGIGGFSDVKDLFRDIEKQHHENDPTDDD